MFDKKYVTSKVVSEVSLDIQNILWNLIDKWKGEEVEFDYLQIYNLSIEYACGEVYQKIVHLQEVPHKKETFYYKNLSKAINAKIFILDEDGNGAMMFAYEY